MATLTSSVPLNTWRVQLSSVETNTRLVVRSGLSQKDAARLAEGLRQCQSWDESERWKVNSIHNVR